MYIYLVWGAEINGWPFEKLKMLSIFPMVYPALSSNVASWEIPKLIVWFFHCHLWLPKGNPPSLRNLMGICFMLCVFCRASQANPRCKPLNSEVRWALRNNKKKSKQNSDSTKAVPNHPRSSKILSFSKFRSREPGVASGSLRPCWFLSGLPNRSQAFERVGDTGNVVQHSVQVSQVSKGTLTFLTAIHATSVAFKCLNV